MLLFASIGCNGGDGGSPSTTGSGGTLDSAERFKPDALYSSKGLLRLAQTPIDVEIEREQSGSEITFNLISGGEVMEVERYKVEGEVFSLLEAAGETFDPTLPLIKFPLDVGKSWKWEGKMRSGDIEHPAWAVVGTSSVGEQLIVTVELEMDNGGSRPSKRMLKFWFEQERGIYKRELGASSTRTSAEE